LREFFTIILLINSFNLIDGIDGLAASLGFIACLFFGTFFFLNGAVSYAVLSFSICGALLGFLMYNFPPAKIFMGDSGSTLIGLCVLYLLSGLLRILSSSQILIINLYLQ
jgi:UDP-N-acetylmuramyl pentapeptide phosphotransferase/UDP-N-acetylglucosamine-1-phosphate transferase